MQDTRPSSSSQPVKAPPRCPTLPETPIVIAADGGLDWRSPLGLRPQIVVGRPRLGQRRRRLPQAERDGARVVRHPTAKDATDLELALDEALALGARPRPRRRRAPAGASTISSRRCSCSASRRSPASRSTPSSAKRSSTCPRRARAARARRASSSTLLAAPRPRRRASRPTGSATRCTARRSMPGRAAVCPTSSTRPGGASSRSSVASCSRSARRDDETARDSRSQAALVACAGRSRARRGGCGSDEATPTEVVLVTHDSFAVSKEVKADVRAGDRADAAHPPGRRRGRGRSTARCSPPATRRATCSSGSTTTCSPVRSTATCSTSTARSELDAVDDAVRAARRPRDADRPRRGVPQHRPRLVRERGLAPPSDARAADAAALQGPARRRERRPPRAPGSRSCSRRWRGSATGGRATGASCAPTTSRVVDGWEEAYTQQFSGAAGSPGKRPIVVSYATSPAAEVIFAGKPLDESPTAAIEDGCFRQVEYAGVLRGADERGRARGKLIDFMLSERFQADVPGSMFVYPVRDGVPLPDAFTKHAILPAAPLTLPPERDRGRIATRGSTSGRRSCSAESAPRPRRRSRPSRSPSSASSSLWPLAAILERSLVADGSSTCRSTCSRVARPLEVAWFTLWQAVVSTALTLAAGLPLAWALARFSFPGRPSGRGAACSSRSCCRPSSSAPRSLAVLPDGLEGTVWAILLAHVFFNVAVVVRIVGAFWSELDDARAGTRRDARRRPVAPAAHRDAAAARAGARARRRSRLPLLLHVVRGRSSSSAAPATRRSRSEIYNQAARIFDLRTAAALALLQLAAVTAAVVVAGRLERRLGGGRRRARAAAATTRGARSAPRRARRGRPARARSPCRSRALVERALSVPGRARARQLPCARATRRRRCSSRRGTRSSTRSSSPPRRR